MVWHGLARNGRKRERNVSDPVFFEDNVNSDVYRKQCIPKVLLPFIKKPHQVEDILFWPDMATSHYTRDVTSFLTPENIAYVQSRKCLQYAPGEWH